MAASAVVRFVGAPTLAQRSLAAALPPGARPIALPASALAYSVLNSFLLAAMPSASGRFSWAEAPVGRMPALPSLLSLRPP